MTARGSERYAGSTRIDRTFRIALTAAPALPIALVLRWAMRQAVRRDLRNVQRAMESAIARTI